MDWRCPRRAELALVSRLGDGDGVDDHRLRWRTAAASQCIDGFYYLATLDDFTEVGVERREANAIAARNHEELTPVGVGPSIRHGK